MRFCNAFFCGKKVATFVDVTAHSTQAHNWSKYFTKKHSYFQTLSQDYFSFSDFLEHLLFGVHNGFSHHWLYVQPMIMQHHHNVHSG